VRAQIQSLHLAERKKWENKKAYNCKYPRHKTMCTCHVQLAFPYPSIKKQKPMNTDLQSSDGISELVVGPQVASLQVRLRQVAEIHQVAVLKQEMSIILLTARLTG
jgi:hypothetical protein